MFQSLFGVFVIVTFLFPISVKAQTGIELDLSTTYTFGEHMTFVAQTKSPLQIQSASIFIQDMVQVTTRNEPVVFNEQGISVYRFDTRQNLVRPFTTIHWWYELTLADGSRMQSQTQSIRYDDDRFNWQSQELNGLRVHWYNGDSDFGLSALNAAQAGLQSIASFFPPDLVNLVDIYIYENASDLPGGGNDWAVGHADSAMGMLMVVIETGLDQNIQMEQRIPHELMHIMLARHIGAGYQNVPAWLREGMATLAEVYPNPEYDRTLMDAASRDALIPIADLCASFSPQIDSAFLAYAETRSFTNFLRGGYGSDGLLTLAKTYASGVDCERGPERAFGVSLAKLEQDWRVTTLGQNNVMAMLGNMAPYLGLLCLVVIVPLIGIVNSMRKKEGVANE
ncbi:MAG TPA: peptidase MA family metallohydrolase [Anaerolineales bacterium]|nr:peptidase MA family metallohydrolase [Anaerolineales bacterium]